MSSVYREGQKAGNESEYYSRYSITSKARCDTTIDIRLQVDVKDQNMDKHPLGIYHSISTQYGDLMMNSVTLCISHGKLPRNA